MRKIVLIVSLLFTGAKAFTAQGSVVSKIQPRRSSPRRNDGCVVFSTPEEQRASLLSEYLAMSQDEKLMAMRALEQRKNAEIDALRQKLEDAKVEKEMSVKAAEEAVAKKYEKQLAQLKGAINSSSPAPSDFVDPAPALTTTINPDDLYLKRNARISEAAAAGNSRWGDREVQRAQQVNSGRVITANTHAPTKIIPPVNGIARASKMPAVTPKASASYALGDYLYQKRNANLAAAAAAGKSRWGGKEIQKVQQSGHDPSLMSAATKDNDVYQGRSGTVSGAAAAGKARWGGKEVDRIQAVNSAPSITVDLSAEVQNDIYVKRNSYIAAAAAAGKSRWGEQEIKRVEDIEAPAKVTPSPKEDSGTAYQQQSNNVIAAAAANKSHWGEKKFEKDPQPNGASSPAIDSGSLHKQRNGNVCAAAAAGKSRWGQQEVERIKYEETSPSPISVIASACGSGSLYPQRNSNVFATPAAGKSHWEEQEIDKLQTPTTSYAPASTGRRVNLGARLVGAAQ